MSLRRVSGAKKNDGKKAKKKAEKMLFLQIIKLSLMAFRKPRTPSNVQREKVKQNQMHGCLAEPQRSADE